MYVNKYRFSFVCACPDGGELITYSVSIVTGRFANIRDLMTWHHGPAKYHETIADEMFAAFGGEQTITATHQGVYIVTERE